MSRLLIRFTLTAFIAALAVGPVAAAPLMPLAPLSVSAPVSQAPALPSSPWTAIGWTLAAFGAITIRDTGTLAKKFVQRAVAASGDYKEGVANKGGDWEASTVAGEANYEAGVQQSIAQKRFGKGVRGSGGKYQANASTLGATRYGPGVQNAQDAWARGVQPSLDTLKGLQLPPKGPRRSPQNAQRSQAVAMALGALKESK